ncbi:DNA binding protein [Dorcoceras hygrometricum]|uniref:DNA binding protein n=1 Tax=Dorcoceras hygrometricum TaxID=472368 RepID=A0A2Z7B8Z4_9LAMI|nr:DNA binding protein [Dorcoceras hygrometricum]
MSREAQEMKRRRRRRFQSQVTVEEAVVSYYSRSCRQLPFILLLTNLLAVAIHITANESLMSNVEQEADNSKRNSEESDVVLKNQQMFRVQQMATVEWIQQKRKDKDSADGFALRTSSRGKSSRKHLKPTTGQPAASISLPPAGQPDASNSTSSLARFAYPVAVFEVSAVASNQRSRWKESMAEIESCKLPQFKGTRFVLFWEIVQFKEERCTEMERRRISLNKRRKELESM